MERYPSFQHANYGNDAGLLVFGSLAPIVRHFLDALRRIGNPGFHQARVAAAGLDDISFMKPHEREAYTYFEK